MTTLELEPIGVVRSPHRAPVDAPRQPRAAAGIRGTIELDVGLEDAVSDLSGFSHIIVLFWFHRASRDVRGKVQPPRSDRRRGVLATRAPHRPNPIGLSVVRLLRVDGLRLEIEGVDMLDGTPVLDIKPYLAYTDAVSDASGGWLADDPRPDWRIELSAPLTEKLDLLRTRFDVDLRPRLEEVLALGPQPHAYRRIRKLDHGYRLSIEKWRFFFTVEAETIHVHDISTGYKPRELADGTAPESHRAVSRLVATPEEPA